MRAETHVLGSSDGYRTLFKSSGVSTHEEGELTVLNFGQAESSDMQALRSSPTVHGRVLPGGRYALTKYVPAGVDDVGRPTIELRSLIMDVAAFDQCVRGRLAQFITDDSIWNAPEFPGGGSIKLPAPCPALSPISSDYSLLDAASSSKAAGSLALIEGGVSGANALVHMIGAVDSAEIPTLSWGTSLLSTGVGVSIATLMAARRPDGRRTTVSCRTSSSIASAAIRASLQEQRPPSSAMQLKSPGGGAGPGGWGTSSDSPYALSGEDSIEARPPGWGTTVERTASRSKGLPLAMLASGAAVVLLILAGIVAAALFLGSSRPEGVKRLEEFQVMQQSMRFTDSPRELRRIIEVRTDFGLDDVKGRCQPSFFSNQTLAQMNESMTALTNELVTSESVSPEILNQLHCVVDEVLRRMAFLDRSSDRVKTLAEQATDNNQSLTIFGEIESPGGLSASSQPDQDLSSPEIESERESAFTTLIDASSSARDWSAIDQSILDFIDVIERHRITQDRLQDVEWIEEIRVKVIQPGYRFSQLDLSTLSCGGSSSSDRKARDLKNDIKDWAEKKPSKLRSLSDYEELRGKLCACLLALQIEEAQGTQAAGALSKEPESGTSSVKGGSEGSGGNGGVGEPSVDACEDLSPEEQKNIFNDIAKDLHDSCVAKVFIHTLSIEELKAMIIQLDTFIDGRECSNIPSSTLDYCEKLEKYETEWPRLSDFIGLRTFIRSQLDQSGSEEGASDSNALTAEDSDFIKIQRALKSLAENLNEIKDVLSENDALTRSGEKISKQGWKLREFMRKDFNGPNPDTENMNLQEKVKSITKRLVARLQKATEGLNECPPEMSCKELKASIPENLRLDFLDDPAFFKFKGTSSDGLDEFVFKFLSEVDSDFSNVVFRASVNLATVSDYLKAQEKCRTELLQGVWGPPRSQFNASFEVIINMSRFARDLKQFLTQK